MPELTFSSPHFYTIYRYSHHHQFTGTRRLNHPFSTKLNFNFINVFKGGDKNSTLWKKGVQTSSACDLAAMCFLPLCLIHVFKGVNKFREIQLCGKMGVQYTYLRGGDTFSEIQLCGKRGFNRMGSRRRVPVITI